MFSDSPEFLVTPEDVSGDIGQEAVLQCVADANPGPAYKWFRNDNKDMVRVVRVIWAAKTKCLPRP